MPYAVETEVAVTIEGIVVRGVIDAVYRNDDGSWEVVDWKTNRTHNADPMQLAIYRIAWAQRQGIGPEQVSAAFVYVADAQVVRPNLPSQAELAARLNAYRANLAVTAQ
jgi:DNA helicase-2/ATP-dependent DNA helicase PcrA